MILIITRLYILFIISNFISDRGTIIKMTKIVK